MDKCQTVFVLDHNHDPRVQIRRQLEEAGHFVISSGNPVEALQMLSGITPPSLILLASELPLLEVKDFLALMRRIPGYDAVPVVHIKRTGTVRTAGTFSEVLFDDLSVLINWLREDKSSRTEEVMQLISCAQ